MLAIQEAAGPPRWLASAQAVRAGHVCLWLAIRFSNIIHGVLGDGGTTLVTRLAGLLLAAIAVQLMADAVFVFIDEYNACPGAADPAQGRGATAPRGRGRGRPG